MYTYVQVSVVMGTLQDSSTLFDWDTLVHDTKQVFLTMVVCGNFIKCYHNQKGNHWRYYAISYSYIHVNVMKTGMKNNRSVYANVKKIECCM
jgi:hypothetical protein